MASTTITRIYQACVNNKDSQFVDEIPPNDSIITALDNTHQLFQDAVNYHLVALAGMVGENPPADSVAERFSSSVREIWDSHPKGVSSATTLQQSLARSLNLTNPSFDDAVADIFDGCECPQALPKVFDSIIYATEKGEGVIQQQGRSLLPRLNWSRYTGGFDFSINALGHDAARLQLQSLLSSDRTAENMQELEDFARKMSLGDTGVKLQSEIHTPESEKTLVEKALAFVYGRLKDPENERWQTIVEGYYDTSDYQASLDDDFKQYRLKLETSFIPRELPRHKGGNIPPDCRNFTLFFMCFCDDLSAALLKEQLGKPEKNSKLERMHDMQFDGEDPTIKSRGKRGYVYSGFTALPNWESSDAQMYSKEWDILAFKEALKTLHGYELKTAERKAECQELESKVRLMEYNEGKVSISEESEEESVTSLPILFGDPRYELALEMLHELAQQFDEDEFVPQDESLGFALSKRTLKGWKELKKEWLSCTSNEEVSEACLLAKVSEVHSKLKGNIGSITLFQALANPKYHAIWKDKVEKESGISRADDILWGIARLHELKIKAQRLREPVRITAAEPDYSARLIQFGDLESLGKPRKIYDSKESGVLQLALIARNGTGHWQAYNADIVYSAPRAERDQLQMGETTMPWIQSMLKPLLKLDSCYAHLDKKAAFTLSVKSASHDKFRNGEPSAWLNFATSLDVTKLQQEIGKASLWSGQLNTGFKQKVQTHYHLNWGEPKKGKSWRQQKQVQQEGFSVLSVDLGLRYAAAWALTQCQLGKPDAPSRWIGGAEGKDWYGRPCKSGIIRLNGEGKTAHRNRDGVQQAAGIRQADVCEVQSAIVFLRDTLKVVTWLPSNGTVTILDLHRAVVEGFHRYLTRYRNFLSWSYRLSDAKREIWDKSAESIIKYLGFGDKSSEQYKAIIDSLSSKDWERAIPLVCAEAKAMKRNIPRYAEQVMNIVLPRKKDSWQWIENSAKDNLGAGVMNPTGERPELGAIPKVWHHGGISIARIELLQKLRRCLQSMNRSLTVSVGEKGIQGRASRNQLIDDPCPKLLEKINFMRDTRVNQLAGQIAAQALGVRLIPSRDGKNGQKDVVHGEYERLAGRKIVDFVVLEDLGRYRTSIDRSKGENSSLMEWSHRSIAQKVKQIIEELCGIPVLFVSPIYTSKFDCMSSEPGFRAMPIRSRDHKDSKETSSEDLMQVRFYEQVLNTLQEEGKDITRLKLFRPKQGGEYFIALGENVRAARNADINAAINIGWRAVASPTCFELLHRLRLEKKKGKSLTLRKSAPNAREKALTSTCFSIHDTLEETAGFFAGFYSSSKQEKVLVHYEQDGRSCDFVHGKVLWGRVKSEQWKRCHELNQLEFRKAGFEEDAELIKRKWLS